MWVFLRFGFSESVMDKNCFQQSIPFCGGDIPGLLADIRRTAAAPEER